MACKYTYQGKTYEAWEFVDVLAAMPVDELMKYLPAEARQKVAMAGLVSRNSEYDQYGDPSPEEARLVHLGIQGKGPIQVAEWLEQNAPKQYAAIAMHVREKLESMRDLGIDFGMEIPTAGDNAHVDQLRARGAIYPTRAEGGKVKIIISVNGSDMKGRVGTSFRTVTHELVHAATMQSIRLGEDGIPQYKGAAKDLMAVTLHVGNHMLANIKNGTASEFERSVASGNRNMLQNPGELVAWALSSHEAQAYLDSIQYEGKSAWTKFVEAIRTVFGLNTSSDTALSEVLRVSEILLQPSDLSDIFGFRSGASHMIESPKFVPPSFDGIDRREQQPGGGRFVSKNDSSKPDLTWDSDAPMPSNRSNPDIRASISFNPADYRGQIERAAPKLSTLIHDVFKTGTTFNWWHRNLGSQFHKAQIDDDFRPVFESAQNYEQDTARFASEAADLAPDLVPKMDTLGDAWKQRKFIENTKDFNAVSPWVWYGTLAGINLSDPANLQYLTDPKALIKKFGDILPKDQPLNALTARQIELLKQYHAAASHSLDTLAKTEMTRLAKTAKLQEASPDMDMLETAVFYFEQIAGEMETVAAQIDDLKVDQKAELALLEDAANDEASGAEKRKTYAKLLIEIRARHQEEMAPLQSKLADFKVLKDGFVGKAEQIEKLKGEGYAPLMRFGKFTVDVVLANKDGKPVKDASGDDLRPFFGMFESESEANAVAREMQVMYPDHAVTQGVLSEYQHSLFKGINPETAEAYARMMGLEADEAFQKYLKLATSNRSAMKRLIHRKGTAGFSFDVTRSLASFITSNARASSANLHMSDMMKAVTDIPKTKGDVADEAIQLLDFVRDPQEKGLAIRSLMFFQFLGGSVAAAAVNLTQTFSTTLPYLSQDKFGGGKLAASAIGKAMKIAASRMFDKNSTTGDAELDRMLKLAEEEGIVAPHEIHMLRGEASRGASMATNNIVWKMLENKYPSLRYTSRLTDVFSAAWGGMFSFAERYNRQVSFIAAYNMTKAKGMSSEQAFEQAKQAVQETQFNYTKSSRSNFGRGLVGSTVMTFKSFLVNYLEFLVRLAKHDPKSAAIALGVLVLLAGAQGLPGADDLDDLIDTLRQTLGYRGNSKEWKREVLADLFGDEAIGKAATNFMLQGMSAFMPLDVSGRLSVGNIIPASGLFKRSDKGGTDDLLEVIGPVGSFISKGVDAVKGVQAGSGVFGAVMESVAPKAVADIYRSVDMLQTGAYRDYKGRKIVDTSAGDAFWKAIGFQPNSVAEVRRVERLIQQDITLFRNVKADVAERWARGVFEGDAAKVAQAKAQAADWNQSNPDRVMAIKLSQIQRRVNEMRKLSSERITKAAPKDIRGNVTAVLRAGNES